MNRRSFLTALLALPLAAKLSKRPKLLRAPSQLRTYDPKNITVTWTGADGKTITMHGMSDGTLAVGHENDKEWGERVLDRVYKLDVPA